MKVERKEIFAYLLLIVLIVVGNIYISFSINVSDSVNEGFYPSKSDENINYLNFIIYNNDNLVYQDIDNYFNENESYYVLSRDTYLVVVKEQDYVNYYKGEDLLGLKILDLSKHKVDGSEVSVLALEDSILEVRDSILEGNLRNNNIDSFYKIGINKELKEQLNDKDVVAIEGKELEDTIINFLDEYILKIQKDKPMMIKNVKILQNISKIDIALLVFTCLFAVYALILIKSKV